MLLGGVGWVAAGAALLRVGFRRWPLAGRRFFAGRGGLRFARCRHLAKIAQMPHLDTQRFDHLSESEVIRRIGELLATAVGRLRQGPAGAHVAAVADSRPAGQFDLVGDPIEQEIVRYLGRMGQGTAPELRAELGVSRSVLAHRLAHLRKSGLCVVSGRARSTRYALRTDFGDN